MLGLMQNLSEENRGQLVNDVEKLAQSDTMDTDAKTFIHDLVMMN